MMMKLLDFKELVYRSIYFAVQKRLNFSVDVQEAFQEHTSNAQMWAQTVCEFVHKTLQKRLCSAVLKELLF